MRRFMVVALVGGLGIIGGSAAVQGAQSAERAPRWSMKATIIEACSCPMFCQCYFNTHPATQGGHAGHGEPFCRFNNVFRIDRGRYGKVKLDGAKFWVAGDLGAEFSDGRMDWAVLIFDPAVTKEQRDAINLVLGHLYPVKWDSFTVGQDAPIGWKASTDLAEAQLDEGRAGHVVLKRANVGMAAQPTVIKNLKYWGAPRNDGFVLMPSDVEAFRLGEKPFEFKGTNGFMLTFDIASRDLQ